MISGLVRSMRPKQWTKNLLVFAGYLFTIEQKHSIDDFLQVLFAFLLFCTAAGAVYIFNDAADVKRDRHHPTKCKRPIASGQVSITAAVIFAFFLIVGSVLSAFRLDTGFGYILSAYLILTSAYSAKLKHVVIVDLLVLAAGFIIRAAAGAVVLHVAISPWLLLCTTLLALFLGLAKRRHELVILEGDAVNHRKILDEYSVAFLDQMINITSAAALMAYSLYTFSAFSETAKSHPYMMVTIPFVIYGIFRYLYLIHTKNVGGHPEQVLLDDKPLLLNIILWAGVVALILKLS
ncbi:MAG TPA: decaprenyl-phosphate phosphoribosyltransferase [Armatimonadota bacterium]|nr:decaprenyl-phosphate phosphoribosyltransferase [Armatimonadota bacterium]HPP75153.1 decaprenyl-phosphate phosphoribosyltransferase [Armatimonadota bacterium]